MTDATNGDKQDKSLMAQRFRGFLPVVVDVETGGFNPDTDALLEIAMVTLRMDDDGYLHPDRSPHHFPGEHAARNAGRRALHLPSGWP